MRRSFGEPVPGRSEALLEAVALLHSAVTVAEHNASTSNSDPTQTHAWFGGFGFGILQYETTLWLSYTRSRAGNRGRCWGETPSLPFRLASLPRSVTMLPDHYRRLVEKQRLHRLGMRMQQIRESKQLAPCLKFNCGPLKKPN